MCVSYFHLAKYGLVPSASPSLQQLFTKTMGHCYVQARVTRNMDKCHVQATFLMWFGPQPTLFPAQTVAATRLWRLSSLNLFCCLFLVFSKESVWQYLKLNLPQKLQYKRDWERKKSLVWRKTTIVYLRSFYKKVSWRLLQESGWETTY